jgi:hypothetical protein
MQRIFTPRDGFEHFIEHFFIDDGRAGHLPQRGRDLFAQVRQDHDGGLLLALVDKMQW